MKISAVVITKNEELVIERCLRSLLWCDEVILVDSGSTDRTVDIASSLGVTIQREHRWLGPATQRNRGIAAARNEWCLLLDADEWITDDLRREIEMLPGDPNYSAFDISRRSSYCGQFMSHGGWWPDPVRRLIRKGHARYEGGIVHERCVAEGTVGKLGSPLMHESFRNLEQVLGKVNAYSTWGAQDLNAAGKSPGLTQAIARGGFAFFRTYILRLGFLDGKRGLMLAISNAEGTYYKYVKAMILAERSLPPDQISGT